MSEFTLTEQSVDPPKPGTDDGKKTVTVFGKDSTATPGTTIPASIDSVGNVGDFKGDQGDQGVAGPIGPTGAPGALATQFVADINNPTEIESLTLAGTGSDIIAHQNIASGSADIVTSYAYDTDGPAKNAPFVMNTGDGGTTRWIATGGKHIQGEIKTTGNVNSRDMAADGTKLDGIESGAQVNPENLAFTNVDNNFSTLQTFQNNAVIQGQAHSETNTLVDAAIITVNFNTGNVQTVTLGGNRTLENPTNIKNGGTYIFIIKQDLTGNRTLVYDTKYKFEGGTAPALSLAANAVDLLSCVSNGTNLFCQLIKDFK